MYNFNSVKNPVYMDVPFDRLTKLSASRRNEEMFYEELSMVTRKMFSYDQGTSYIYLRSIKRTNKYTCTDSRCLKISSNIKDIRSGDQSRDQKVIKQLRIIHRHTI